MLEPDLKDTHPNPVAAPAKKKIPRWLPLLVVVLLIAIGLLGGYGSGLGVRYSAQKTQVSGILLDQFQLGVQAMDTGQYEIARKHFEVVLNQDPDFPGIKSAYADLLLRMQTTPTSAYTPTPAITPTPDLRSVEEQIISAQELLNADKWDETISILDNLRKNAPTFKTALVDGMYYQALYQRGLSKIYPSECANINLEGSLYDLTLAERFGPLDPQIDAWRIYARLYIAGSSVWDLDWVRAQDYFNQVRSAFPLLMDASCQKAEERWRQATVHYADQLADAGDFCAAAEQYEDAFTIASPANEAVYPRAADAADECSSSNEPVAPPPVTTPIGETPTPDPNAPTVTPTETSAS